MAKKQVFRAVLLAAGMGALATLCAHLLLRNLGPFLSFDPQFSAIFAQIATAKMTAPVVLPACLSLGAAWGIGKLWQRNHKVGAVLAGLLSVLVLFVLSLLLTRVNGIRFVDVLVSLVDVLQKGGL